MESLEKQMMQALCNAYQAGMEDAAEILRRSATFKELHPNIHIRDIISKAFVSVADTITESAKESAENIYAQPVSTPKQ